MSFKDNAIANIQSKDTTTKKSGILYLDKKISRTSRPTNNHTDITSAEAHKKDFNHLLIILQSYIS